jgi:hypothetical protein
MQVIDRLIKRIENNTNEKITVRKVVSGHSKGLTGIYRNKTRIFVSSERVEIIKRLNDLYNWSILTSQSEL